MRSLSTLDKNIIKILLKPDGGRTSSKAIADVLDIPATTVQRRRRKLEDGLLTTTYSLNLKMFGLHKIDFLVATEKGQTMSIAKQLLKLEEIVYVGRSIGQQTIDLHVQAILEGSEDILRVLEMLKGMAGVKDAAWSEVIQMIGKKSAVPDYAVDRL